MKCKLTTHCRNVNLKLISRKNILNNLHIAATGEGGKAPGTEDGTEFLGVLEFETGADDGTVTGTLTGGGGGGAMGASAGAGQGGLMKLW